MPTAGNKIYTSDLNVYNIMGGNYSGGITAPYITVQRATSANNVGGGIEYTYTSTLTYTMYVIDNKWQIDLTSSNKVLTAAYLTISSGKLTVAGGYGDYAEIRAASEKEPGTCLMETSSGIMEKSNKRLIGGCHIISDTYGFLLGDEEEGVPIGLKGRVLIKLFKDKKYYHLGDCVCSAPNGTVDVMTPEEIKKYPECIIGTVCEFPTTEEWQVNKTEKIKVNNRIWIKI